MEPGSVVLYLQLKSAVSSPGADLDPSWSYSRDDPVFDSVLDYRLKDQIRNSRLERLRLDLQAHCQAVVEAHLLDLQIAPQKFQLFL